MMKPVLDIKLFRKDASGQTPMWERMRSQKALLWMMEGLCRVNQDQLVLNFKQKKPLPYLYKSGVVYQREDGTEDWQDIYTTVEKRWGDCEDLACWRVAELRTYLKRPASPYLTFREIDGVYHYHALVIAKGPDGWRIEDPSRKLGMGFEDAFGELSAAQRFALIPKFDAQQKQISSTKLKTMREVG